MLDWNFNIEQYFVNICTRSNGVEIASPYVYEYSWFNLTHLK